MRGRLFAGVGLRRGVGGAEIARLVREAMLAVGARVDAIASPAFKRHEQGLPEAATLLEVELLFVDDRTLRATQARCVTHSAIAARAVGYASVAEASALAAAGPKGRLVLPRIRGPGVTVAVAERA